MSKRRRKVLPPKDRSKPKEQPKDAMAAPNHMVPLLVPQKPHKRTDTQRYPLLHLSLPESPGCGIPGRLLFFDKLHELVSAFDRGAGAPPSWMDPEVFLRMVQKDERLRKFKKAPSAKQLQPILEELFESQYVVYLFEMFEEAAPLLAEWLAAHYAYVLDET